jgi:hypothetical protein
VVTSDEGDQEGEEEERVSVGVGMEDEEEGRDLGRWDLGTLGLGRQAACVHRDLAVVMVGVHRRRVPTGAVARAARLPSGAAGAPGLQRC